tara:strand:- start:144 stop:443 length:300 start_codon:yes stop_codon:yes gene_type:complete
MFTAADTRRAHTFARLSYADGYRAKFRVGCAIVAEEKRALAEAEAVATACIIIGRGQAEHAAHLETIDTRGRWFHGLAAAALTLAAFTAAPAYAIAVSL